MSLPLVCAIVCFRRRQNEAGISLLQGLVRVEFREDGMNRRIVIDARESGESHKGRELNEECCRVLFWSLSLSRSSQFDPLFVLARKGQSAT